MIDLPGWGEPAAVVLSCPGPLRRHTAALLPMAEVALPQVLLGAESQLLAFAAAASGLAGRLFFAPFPEMFPDARSLRQAWRRAGGAGTGGRLVHLRFGGVRAARVLKGVRNGCVVAERGAVAPLTASHHPFASGAVLPAAIGRLFTYGPEASARRLDGRPIPSGRLSPDCVLADLATLPPAADADGNAAGLDLVSLADFRSGAWASGPVQPRRARTLADDAPGDAVLLPWNMDHPGSIVPALLERLARLHPPRGARTARPPPRTVLLPFNYIGQTGIIRQLIRRLREATPDPETVLGEVFLARVGAPGAVGALHRLARCAWVDGNDPEHWWTLARLSACGIAPILIGPPDLAVPDGVARVLADEPVWVAAETRCGTLTFPSSLPSLRALPGLLALTARRGRVGPAGVRPVRGPRPAEAPPASPPPPAASRLGTSQPGAPRPVTPRLARPRLATPRPSTPRPSTS